MPVQQTKEVITEVTTLSQLPPPEVKSEAIKKVNAAPPPPLKSTIKFTAPVIKKDEEVREEDEIKTQEEVTNSKVAISVADVKGNDDENGADIADLKEIAQDEPQDTPFQVVEQMPEYPGGRAAMMKYIGKMMKYPTIAMENGIEGKVILRFVVLPTGEIGNVEVLRSLDPTCNTENDFFKLSLFTAPSHHFHYFFLFSCSRRFICRHRFIRFHRPNNFPSPFTYL